MRAVDSSDRLPEPTKALVTRQNEAITASSSTPGVMTTSRTAARTCMSAASSCSRSRSRSAQVKWLRIRHTAAKTITGRHRRQPTSELCATSRLSVASRTTRACRPCTSCRRTMPAPRRKGRNAAYRRPPASVKACRRAEDRRTACRRRGFMLWGKSSYGAGTSGAVTATCTSTRTATCAATSAQHGGRRGMHRSVWAAGVSAMMDARVPSILPRRDQERATAVRAARAAISVARLSLVMAAPAHRRAAASLCRRL
mmetsp:Transcript_30609/g.71184  ORF Transcript_30609/g.71184 Transcript_30609/m.71184 type:complete len:256 (-) Transcript_30609:97-864(-)